MQIVESTVWSAQKPKLQYNSVPSVLYIIHSTVDWLLYTVYI